MGARDDRWAPASVNTDHTRVYLSQRSCRSPAVDVGRLAYRFPSEVFSRRLRRRFRNNRTWSSKGWLASSVWRAVKLCRRVRPGRPAKRLYRMRRTGGSLFWRDGQLPHTYGRERNRPIARPPPSCALANSLFDTPQQSTDACPYPVCYIVLE